MSPNVSSKLTTLSFFPGLNENSSRGGDELNNSSPDFNGELVDNWFHGDFTTELENSLSSATQSDRDLEEFPDRLFKHYRFKNQIEVSFTSSDNQSIDGSSLEVTTNNDTVSVTLEDENNQLRDDLPQSVLFNGDKKKKATTRPRYRHQETNTINGKDAVQVSKIWGSYDPFVESMLEYVGDTSIRELFSLLGLSPVGLVTALISTTPTIYTWLEFTVLADGTELARVWDASRYPKHVGYLGDDKMAATSFEQGEDWNANEYMNDTFNDWVFEEQTHAVVPYESPHIAYLSQFEDLPFVGGTDPLLLFGKDDTGTPLGEQDVKNRLPDEYVYPFIQKI